MPESDVLFAGCAQAFCARAMHETYKYVGRGGRVRTHLHLFTLLSSHPPIECSVGPVCFGLDAPLALKLLLLSLLFAARR